MITEKDITDTLKYVGVAVLATLVTIGVDSFIRECTHNKKEYKHNKTAQVDLSEVRRLDRSGSDIKTLVDKSGYYNKDGKLEAIRYDFKNNDGSMSFLEIEIDKPATNKAGHGTIYDRFADVEYKAEFRVLFPLFNR